MSEHIKKFSKILKLDDLKNFIIMIAIKIPAVINIVSMYLYESV